MNAETTQERPCCEEFRRTIRKVLERHGRAFRLLHACDSGTAENCLGCGALLLNGERCEDCSEKGDEEGKR